jgi:hypothetical protein
VKEQPKNPLEQVWLAISSLRTTAILAIVLALLAGVAAMVPQGWAAVELARLAHATQIQEMVRWGLTEVFDSAWIRAVGVLLLVNVAAVVYRSRMTDRADDVVLDPPRSAPHAEHLTAPMPERAVETLRETFRSLMRAPPTAEKVEGSRVVMMFETAKRAELAPLLAHLGLVLLVIGAGLSVKPPPRSKSVASAVLAVTDSRTGTVGTFDMVSGEVFQFFQWRPRYVIRDYVIDKNGLGPAIRMEQSFPDQENRTVDFWVYQNAPKGFDARHRKDVVAIEAVRLGITALPGNGLASQPASFLLIFGLGLLCFGALAGSRARGRVWLEADGDAVRIVGVPEHAGDPSFERGFARWSLMARATLES